MSQHRRRNKTNSSTSGKRRWWLILLSVAGFLLIGAAVYALLGKPDTSQPATYGPPPSLQVDKELVDLGDVKLNQPVRVSFQLTNTGEGPLQLSKEPYIEVVEGC